jgi:hypothetical protein
MQSAIFWRYSETVGVNNLVRAFSQVENRGLA